jgi:hypothetical protein
MGKSWVYRRLRGGETPSVKPGRSTKVKRADAEEYLENRRFRPSDPPTDLGPFPEQPLATSILPRTPSRRILCPALVLEVRITYETQYYSAPRGTTMKFC